MKRNKHFWHILICLRLRPLEIVANNLGSQTVYDTTLQSSKCSRHSELFMVALLKQQGGCLRN